jgi:hypothetical protein
VQSIGTVRTAVRTVPMDLSSNPVGVKGAMQAVSSLVRCRPSLISLKLELCHLTPADLSSLLKVLEESGATLEELSISCNNEDNMILALALVPVLHRNRSLHVIDAYGCDIPVQGLRLLAEALQSNTTLTKLRLNAATDATRSILNSISSMLKRNEHSSKDAGSAAQSPAAESKIVAPFPEAAVSVSALPAQHISTFRVDAQLAQPELQPMSPSADLTPVVKEVAAMPDIGALQQQLFNLQSELGSHGAALSPLHAAYVKKQAHTALLVRLLPNQL